jgi:DNA repair exonuclease SbcCD ATPase subunit
VKVEEVSTKSKADDKSLSDAIEALRVLLETQKTQHESLSKDLKGLRDANQAEHESLLSRVTLLNQKQESKEAELNERIEEAGRCIELLKESVESLEGFLEKGLQSVMEKS